MATVTVNGILRDPTGSFPTTGSVIFQLDGYFTAASGQVIAPKAERAPINPATGVFSIALESTKDGTPSNRLYKISVESIIEGVTINFDIANVPLKSSPTTQELRDILLDALLLTLEDNSSGSMADAFAFALDLPMSGFFDDGSANWLDGASLNLSHFLGVSDDGSANWSDALAKTLT